MTTEGAGDQSQKFAELFGVSEEELRARGVDPDEYARRNIGRALRDRRHWDLVLSKSSQYGILWTRWGFRGFLAMFVGLGFLALSKVSGVHWVGIGGAAGMWLVALAATVLMWRYRHQYVEACKQEGTHPSWRRRP